MVLKNIKFNSKNIFKSYLGEILVLDNETGRNLIINSDVYDEGTNSWTFLILPYSNVLTKIQGKKITMSFDYDVINTLNVGRFLLEISYRQLGTVYYTSCQFYMETGTTTSGRYYQTFEINNFPIDEIIYVGIFTQFFADYKKIGRPQIEISEIGSPWKKALED